MIATFFLILALLYSGLYALAFVATIVADADADPDPSVPGGVMFLVSVSYIITYFIHS